MSDVTAFLRRREREMISQHRQHVSFNAVYRFAPQIFPALPPDVARVFVRHGIFTSTDVESLSDDEILSIKGVGLKKLEVIRKVHPYNPELGSPDLGSRTWQDVVDVIYELAAIPCPRCGQRFMPYGGRKYCSTQCGSPQA